MYPILAFAAILLTLQINGAGEMTKEGMWAFVALQLAVGFFCFVYGTILEKSMSPKQLNRLMFIF